MTKEQMKMILDFLTWVDRIYNQESFMEDIREILKEHNIPKNNLCNETIMYDMMYKQTKINIVSLWQHNIDYEPGKDIISDYLIKLYKKWEEINGRA